MQVKACFSLIPSNFSIPTPTLAFLVVVSEGATPTEAI